MNGLWGVWRRPGESAPVYLNLEDKMMSEAKHSAGPWSVGDNIGDGNLWVAPADKNAPVVCDLVPREADFTEEDEANARLIASAPDLLALVHRAVADRIDNEWLKKARAVIAKAEGRQ
jgi:hypothetical protein